MLLWRAVVGVVCSLTPPTELVSANLTAACSSAPKKSWGKKQKLGMFRENRNSRVVDFLSELPVM